MKKRPQRVMIIGCGGSGKSTLAQILSEKLSLNLIHLDLYYWKPNWVETPKTEWESSVKELVKLPQWIMDGNYGGTMDIRLDAADTIIFLYFPTWLCLWREIKRSIKYYGVTRPTMTAGCPTRFSMKFWSYILNYNKTRSPGILKKLGEQDKTKRVLIFKSQAEVNRFILEEIGNATL